MKSRYLQHFATTDPTVAAIIPLCAHYVAGVRQDGSVFEILARSIASQQLSGIVARKIIERLIDAAGGHFPTPAELAALPPEAVRAAGFSFAKIAALKDLAAHALDGRLPDDAALAAMEDEEIIDRCVAVRGIGRWTAQMLLMFHFGRPDVMPADDFGVRNGFRLAYGLKGLPKPRALHDYAERWKPYRSAGAWYMWRAVELHQQGLLPKRAGRAPRIDVVAPKADVPEKGGVTVKVKAKVAAASNARKRTTAKAPVVTTRTKPKPKAKRPLSKAARALQR